MTTFFGSDVGWYNLYNDSIYYTQFISEGRFYHLMKCGLDGENPVILVRDKRFTSGIVSDGMIYMYSYTDETLLAYRLDGTINNDIYGFYDLKMDLECGFCCEDGWIYYTSKEDNDIHRVSVNGRDDAAIGAKHSALVIYSGLNGIYFVEDTLTERDHWYQRQAWMTWLEDGQAADVLDIGEPHFTWKLSEAMSSDFDWTEEDDGVVITGYNGAFTNFSIPDDINGKPVVRIGETAFEESDIQQIGLPKDLQKIDARAFDNCQSLSFVGLPEGLTEIGWGAFAGCSSMAKVDLPDSLTKIGALAFADTVLSSVTIPAKTETIGAGAFAPYTRAELTAYSVKEGNPLFTTIDGVLFYENRYAACLAEYPSGREGTYVIPDGTDEIMSYAFAHCKLLTELTIPESVLVIGENAFRDTGLTEITVSSRCKLPDDLGDENLTVNYYP